MSAGDKPPAVTINDNDITCAENTQKERTWNANVQLTPITNEQRTPVTCNAQRSPNNNMQHTPITEDVQQTPNVQWDSMESLNAAKQNDTPQTSLTALVRDVVKEPQNNETPRTYQTPTLTNAVTPVVPSVPLATVSRRPGDMTQTDNATQQPKINVRDSVNEIIPIPQTNKGILSHQSTHLVQEDMTMGGQTRTDVTELGLGPRGRENQFHNSLLRCGKPKSATRLFGTQAASYTDLLAQTTDDDDFSLSYAVGGAIRHSYNCDEVTSDISHSDKMDQQCSDCSFYKAQNEELQEQLRNLKEKCGSKY